MSSLSAARSNDRTPTGVEGFDEIADGGLPRSGITVVMGGAGAGKTIFGLQVLARGAREAEPGILVAFEESAEQILANTARFSWGGDLRSGVHVLDAQLSQSVQRSGQFDLIGLLAVVAAAARTASGRLIVFDGIDVLLGYLAEPSLIRREVFRLRDWVHENGFTALVTAKADAAEARPMQEYDFLQFMADCVVTMHHRVVDGTARRSTRVAKYRGAPHSANEFPLIIGRAGLEVAASAARALAHTASTERVSTGVERLDSMLAGGFHRGSSVLITGVPGTAKSTLAAAFADAAAQRGERTLYVSFDEAPDQIVRNVASIGIRLAPHLEAGLLHIRAFRARSENLEAHLARLRGLMREVQPQHLIIDPLSALSGNGLDSDAAALEVLDLAKSLGVTSLSTSLLASPSVGEQTPLNLSTISDTWIHLSYLNQGGERNRALTIIKSRGTGHSNQVRELVLASDGITLSDVYSAGGEVLMGTLRWEKENEARRARALASNAAALRTRKAEQALADTRARIAALTSEVALQEAELMQIKADDAATLEHRTTEIQGLLARRRADPPASSAPPGPAALSSRGGT